MAENNGDTGSTGAVGRANPPTRRALLGGTGALAAAFLAGCTGGGSADGDDRTPGSSAGDGERDTESRTATDDSAGPGTEPGTDPAGTVTDNSGEPGAETETRTATVTPHDTETAVEANCGEVVPAFEDSVEFRGDMEDTEGRMIDVVGRTHGENQYFEYTHSDGTVMELYEIEDSFYIVTDQGCIRYSEPPSGTNTITEDQIVAEDFWNDREAVGTEELDGDRMVVYEFEVDTSSYVSEYTAYVNCETRRLYRLDQNVPEEGATSVAYYENWGGADPISPPEQNCEEY